MNDPEGIARAFPTADARHLDLLRHVASAGGALSPIADPNARHGYAYDAAGDDVRNDLEVLAKRNYLEARFFDRVSLCPKCDSHHLNVREICPTCRRAHLTSEGLFHHFRCGYVGLPSEFSAVAGDAYRCPKCNAKMHHLGIEYDRLGKAFLCRGCGVISENPPVEAVCLACGARAPAENLVSANVFTFLVTSRGAAAVRRGSLLDEGEEPVSVADQPVYRRAVILEFLASEVKRLRQLNEVFSVLLAKFGPELAAGSADPVTARRLELSCNEKGENDGDPRAQWLARLRDSLREVDLIGQIGDALYLVILPRTKRREAEGLRRRIMGRLGAESPFSLTAAEISDERQLTQLLSGLDHRSPPA